MTTVIGGQNRAKYVSSNYQAAAIFERHGLDFCCGGRSVLEKACRLYEVDLAGIVIGAHGARHPELSEVARNFCWRWSISRPETCWRRSDR